MEEMKFSLMRRDIPVCAVTIDPVSGAMLRVSKPVHPELLPLGGNIDAQELRAWWQLRAVPVSQGSFKSREVQLLAYVHDAALLDSSKLPSPEELRHIYEADPMITYIDAILLGYQKKIDLLYARGML